MPSNKECQEDIIRQTRAQLRESLDALRAVTEIVEHGVPEPSHPGACGPESGCDGVCMELASIGEDVRHARAVLAKYKEGA